MSSTDWGQPGPAPTGDDRQGAMRLPNVIKAAIVLALLAGLAWLLIIAGQYFKTGKPLSEIPGVPNPVANLLGKTSFEYVSSINGLQNPMGVAVSPDGRVYVTETGGERKIHVYDRQGKELASLVPPGTQAANRVPVYVAVSPGGDVYVSDRGTAAIYIFAPDGTSKGTVTPPKGFEDWHPLGLTFDKAGNLYVADVTPDKHRVIVLDPTGTLKLSFGSQGEGDGQFWYPNGIAIDSEGRIFVADSNNGRMQAFDKDGKFLFKIARGMSAGDLSMPRGIAIDGDNHLLIVDTSRSAVQEYQVTKSTDDKTAPVQYMGAFSGAEGRGISFQFPNGLALDSHGQIYVTDRANNRVQIWKY